jgi:hypothetical protein
MCMKIKPTPTPPKPLAAIRMPNEKPGLSPVVGSTDRALKESSPDGPRSGYSVGPSGRRQYRDEIPYPPPDAPHKPYKVTK